MTKFFDIDAANQALEEVAPLLATLADQRAELIRLRDRTLAAHASATGGGPDLEPEDIREALLFAAEAVRERELPLLAAS